MKPPNTPVRQGSITPILQKGLLMHRKFEWFAQSPTRNQWLSVTRVKMQILSSENIGFFVISVSTNTQHACNTEQRLRDLCKNWAPKWNVILSNQSASTGSVYKWPPQGNAVGRLFKKFNHQAFSFVLLCSPFCAYLTGAGKRTQEIQFPISSSHHWTPRSPFL